jgi:hypothetical protein
VFFGSFFRGELGYRIKVRALDLGFRRSEHADLYSKWIKSSAGFLVLVSVLRYEPQCSLIGWRSIFPSVRSPRLYEDSILLSYRLRFRDIPLRLF